MHQAEEDLLVFAAQDGNRKALNILCRRYQAPLLRYAYSVSKDADLAHDAVQDAWVKLSKNIRKLEDPRALRTWLYQLVRWSSLDILRKHNKLAEYNELFDEELHSNLDEQDEVLEGDNLKTLIKRLPIIEKQIIQLFYIDELNLTEIANILDVPIGTVKSRLNRARNLLKEKFIS